MAEFNHPLTLYYFPLRARGEAIRMILNYGGIPFNDVVISMEEWKGIKQRGELAPFGQLPCMSLPDGSIIAQSGAIARYAAKLAKVYPEDPMVAAKADMIFEFAQELNMISPLLNFWPISTDVWKNNYELFFNNLPRQLSIADRLLGDQSFFCGHSPCHGDFALFHVMDACRTMQADCLNNFPRLAQFMNRTSQLPGVREYLANRLPPQSVGLCGSYMQVEVAKIHHPK
ncbi:hypothetical protein EON65_13720 [archaeon]|nr:MAG: hypothetical protein EON65_13720 [archaeon]